MDSEPLQLRQSALLSKLLSGKTQKMTGAAIAKYFQGAKVVKHLPFDEAEVQQALQDLVGAGVLSEKRTRSSVSYLATATTAEHLKKLPTFPPPPPSDPQMKAYVLMGMLAAGDRWLLRKEIKALITPTISKTLGFTKDAVAPLMNMLAQQQAVEEQDPGRSGKDEKVSYHLTARGVAELAGASQHPHATFKLSGEAINRLLQHGAAARPASRDGESIAHATPVEASKSHAPAVPLDTVRMAVPNGAVPHGPQTVIKALLTDDSLLDEARRLLRERHSHTGLVPIFELRRRVKAQFGDLAASHDELDARLRRLRREHRLRLVSLSDRSAATAEQLSDSVAGEDEMFYYVGELQ